MKKRFSITPSETSSCKYRHFFAFPSRSSTVKEKKNIAYFGVEFFLTKEKKILQRFVALDIVKMGKICCK